jgi:hypothetical protein
MAHADLFQGVLRIGLPQVPLQTPNHPISIRSGMHNIGSMSALVKRREEVQEVTITDITNGLMNVVPTQWEKIV